jgi:hypothetical protein
MLIYSVARLHSCARSPVILLNPYCALVFDYVGHVLLFDILNLNRFFYVQLNRSRHELFCKELKYAMVCDNFESTVSVAVPAIPSEIDAKKVDLGQDIVEHLKKFVKVPASSG